MTYDLPRWIACQVQPHCETKTQRDIEDIGIGTFLPHYTRFDGRRRRDLALLPGYLFIAGEDISGVYSIDAVTKVLGPIRENEIHRLMLPHALRDYNQIRHRAPNGSFARRPQKKRRRRPRHGRRYQGRGV